MKFQETLCRYPHNSLSENTSILQRLNKDGFILKFDIKAECRLIISQLPTIPVRTRSGNFRLYEKIQLIG